MNPPFVRDTGHEGKKKGVPNPMFAAFSTTKDEQKKMAEVVKRLTVGTSAHGNAGEASIFPVLANKKLRPKGTLALVMPLSLMSGEAWEKSRRLLATSYRDLVLVSITGAADDEMSFSADTDMGECLVVGRKSVGGSARATFVILNKRPPFQMLGAGIATQIRRLVASKNMRRLEDGPVGGSPHDGEEHPQGDRAAVSRRLRAEFRLVQARLDGRSVADLRKFRDKLGALRLFDPACGCGNFLIIAYRELRTLEIDVLREIASRATATQLALAVQSVVEVDQFYGIEIGEFPARIAATALWMMDHIMNNRLSLEFGQTYARIPIEKSPHIRNADALEIDWADVLPPDECSYVFGNPPFGGSKFQSPEQRAQVRRVAALGGSGGTLDYVAAWVIRAGDYVRQAQPADGSRPPRVGFVATNSITQGEQVAQLWPLLLDHRRLEIAFAHRTFAWGSDARGKAHVHVVIIGLDVSDHAPRDRRLFYYEDINGEPLESRHAVITPYLFDGGALANPHLVVREEGRPINGMVQLLTGSQPIDDGRYIFNTEERLAFVDAEPDAAPFLRPFVGAHEYLQGGDRWILALHDASPSTLARLPCVRERIAAVRAYRRASNRKSTLKLADTPTLWQVNALPTAPFLVIPEVSSERREYVPIGWLGWSHHPPSPRSACGHGSRRTDRRQGGASASRVCRGHRVSRPPTHPPRRWTAPCCRARDGGPRRSGPVADGAADADCAGRASYSRGRRGRGASSRTGRAGTLRPGAAGDGRGAAGSGRSR